MQRKVRCRVCHGNVFTCHFGFIPGTKGEDGDPLDGMVVSEFSSFTGAHIECRLIGALLASQTATNGKMIRNDRYFFVPVHSIVFEHIKVINDFGPKHNFQLKEFFINYNQLENKKFTPLKIVSPARAYSLIRNATEY